MKMFITSLLFNNFRFLNTIKLISFEIGFIIINMIILSSNN